MNSKLAILKTSLPILLVSMFSLGVMKAKAQVTNDISAAAATILAPNAFTPNGDGVDDVFSLIVDENAEVIDFRIYNRWGNSVWATNKNQAWDGSINGLPQPMETYIYCAIVLDKITGQKVMKKGDVTLIR